MGWRRRSCTGRSTATSTPATSWVLDDGRIAYLDFGIMGELPAPHRDALRDALYTVMIDGDYTRVVRAWQRIGILGPDVGPVEEVAARLQVVLDPMFDMTLGEASLAEILRRQIELQQEYSARPCASSCS